MSAAPESSRLRASDGLRVAVASLHTRRLRAALTAVGIAIGIAAMVAVLGVSAASRAELLATLDALGTNLLTVTPGQTFTGDSAVLPAAAPGAIRRVGPVEQASAVAAIDATVHRTDRVPKAQTGGIRIAAAEPALLSTLQGELAAGRFLDDATDRYPTLVLGATAARRLGVTRLDGQPLVWLGDRWFAVIGILEPLPLASEIDATGLIGFPAAREVIDTDPPPTTVYVRTDPTTLDSVRSVLPRTTNPQAPETVAVSRPSDALAARAAADTAFTGLLLGLGGVALLVGGIGVANVMLITVLERRSEIGLRRALGATRRHIRFQFLLEAVALSGTGGLLGVLAGSAITVAYATQRGWPFTLPWVGLAAAAGLAVLVGGIAGLYPAGRAARLQPAEAIRRA